MPEAIAARRGSRSMSLPRRALFASLVAGIVLTAVAGFGGFVAAVSMLLAQPAFAFAAAHARGRTHVDARAARREAAGLLLLWGGALAIVSALVAWPLSALLQKGSLGAAFGLSFVAGVALIGLWRLWPLWHGMESEGGRLQRHWRELGELEPGAWRGLGVAVIVAAVIGAAVLLAWPGLLDSSGRWVLAAAMVLGSAPLHWLLQRVRPADALPELAPIGVPAADTDIAADEVPLETALYAAARAGRVEQALQLIDSGANVHAPPPYDDRDQRSLAVLAAVLPDLRLLRVLIAHGIDLNAAHAGMTPLLAATRDSWHGRPDAVMTLLANGADPRAVDQDGNTPLHHAARSSDPGVAALLRDAAADIDAINAEGLSPLGVACAAGNWRLAKFLLERGAKPEPAGGQPALIAAATPEEDDPAGVQLLLKHKAKVDARDANGRSALHGAAFLGHQEIVEALLGAGADPAAVDRLGHTPVLDAVRGGHLATLDRLLAQLPRGGAAEAAAIDAHGRGALALAAMSERATPALIERLLELGLDAEQRDFEDKRAIDRAAEAGRWALVAALDRAYPLPSAVADAAAEPDAPLPDRAPAALLREGLHAQRGAELSGLAQLLAPAELGALLHDGGAQEGTDGRSPLGAAQIERLLQWGAATDVRDASGDTPLFALLSRGPSALGALQALLRHGVSPAGAGGLARFLAACAASEQAARGLEYFALDLLERGADPFARSPAGDPPLTLAVRLGWSRLVERLLAIGVDLDARDSHGVGALHLAAALGREAMLKQLVARGASPDLLAADGQTPLGVALASARRDLADWLDWRGWPLPKRPLRTDDVPAAAIVGDADAVRRLLGLGLPVDATDSQGCSALLRAAGGGHRAVVDLLLARGADPQRPANSGATPLSAAVSMRHVEIVDRLIAAGASLEQRLPGDLTVLMVASALGLPDMAARLLAAGADVHAQDAQGRMALHCAAMFGFSARERARLVALLDTLLLAGAEADRPAGGATPLLLLLGARAEPGSPADEDVLMAGLDQLLDYDARLDAQDPRGFGPLHLAALHGLLRVAQKLLRAGADPGLRDALNRTPREIAVMRGFVDIAAELQTAPASPQEPSVSMARFLRDR